VRHDGLDLDGSARREELVEVQQQVNSAYHLSLSRVHRPCCGPPRVGDGGVRGPWELVPGTRMPWGREHPGRTQRLRHCCPDVLNVPDGGAIERVREGLGFMGWLPRVAGPEEGRGHR